MAEEKYIFAFEVDNKDDLKDNLPDCNSCTYWPCDENCFGRKRGISRQEAIERMAKAICKETNYQCSVCDFGDNKEKCEEWIVFQYKSQAEAALNALLEAQNER